ncbi:MAG: hypothetical protein V1720_06790 [bacterium]
MNNIVHKEKYLNDMNNKQVVIGIFENESYASIAKRDLGAVGIRATINKDRGNIYLPMWRQSEEVQLMVLDTQIDEAKKILKTKFN